MRYSDTTSTPGTSVNGASSRTFPLAVLLAIATTCGGAVRANDTLAPVNERFLARNASGPPSFQRHVVPLMGRLGCSGRACHGSFQGRGDFRLSLFGYDFKADHDALLAGDEPRVDIKAPSASLILNKPTSDDEHEGGQRFAQDGWEYELLKSWIEAGGENDGGQVGSLTRLEVAPAEIRFSRDDQAESLRVIAHWTDGTREDVTPLCRFRTNDDSVAKISEAGVVESCGPGDTHVVVFYDNGVTPIQVLRPVSDKVGQKYPQVPMPTKVDELVVAKLEKLGIVPSELGSDAEFLRRVSLDISGTLPTSDEVERFGNDKSPDKRARKIDELLDRPGYAAWWTTKLCDVTGNNPQNMGNNVFRDVESRQWYEWIHHRVATNVPYDELVAGIVTATGRREGQQFEEFCQEMTDYYSDRDGNSFAEHDSLPHFWSRRNVRQPEEKALSVAYAFLGVRLQCAQCHKHPFDQWSQDDFKQFTTFFQPVQYNTHPDDRAAARKMQESLGLLGKRGNEQRQAVAALVRKGEAVPFQEVFVSLGSSQRSPAGKRPAARGAGPQQLTAKLLGGEPLTFGPGDDPREALMEWMRNEANPYFARAFVNRVWASYFNVGIIDPPDDLNLANPPSNGPLLDWLTGEFIARGYDMKWLHRTIANSRTYQLSWRPNETNRLDNRNFSRSVPRRLPAEVLYDVVKQATAADPQCAAMQTDMDDRAIGIAGNLGRYAKGTSAYALMTFGKPQRASNCDCERSLEPSLLQTLYLRNDAELLAAIDRRGGWLDQALPGGARPAGPVGNSTRRPSANQDAFAVRQLQRIETRIRIVQRQNNPQELARLRQQRNRLRDRLAAMEKSQDAQAATPEKNKLDELRQLELVRAAYLRTVSRPPTKEELARARQHFHDSESPHAALRDLLWALLNTKEFSVNH